MRKPSLGGRCPPYAYGPLCQDGTRGGGRKLGAKFWITTTTQGTPRRGNVECRSPNDEQALARLFSSFWFRHSSLSHVGSAPRTRCLFDFSREGLPRRTRRTRRRGNVECPMTNERASHVGSAPRTCPVVGCVLARTALKSRRVRAGTHLLRLLAPICNHGEEIRAAVDWPSSVFAHAVIVGRCVQAPYCLANLHERDSTTLTQATAFIGTRIYCAPEQLLPEGSREADER